MTKLPPLPKMNMSRLLKLGETKKSAVFIIVAVAAIALNVLIQPFGLRLDLSKNQAYTLSSSSKKIIRDLNNKVKMTFFVSKDLPTRLMPIRRDITDMLNEYQRSSGGWVNIEVRDPKTDDKARELAVKNGINEVRFSQLDQDKFNVSTGYFGLLISYNGQDKAIPQITDLNNIEYNITSTVYMMSRKDTPKIGIVGQDAPPTQGGDPLMVLRQLLQQQFTVENLFLATPDTPPTDTTQPTPAPAIDPSFKTLLVFDAPPKKYSDQEINKIKEYLNKKGKVVVFLNGVQVDEQAVATQAATHNLFGLTKEYGIQVNKDYVLSASAELINFGSGVSQYFIPYPLWLKTNVFNPQTGFFGSINQLSFPWVSSLTLQPKNGYQVTDLIKTDDRSWLQTGNFVLDPQKLVNDIPSTPGQYTIGALSRNKDGGELMVIPSSRFALSPYLSQQSDNLNFVLNVVNNFASDGALSGIRQRAVDIYPLPSLSDTEKNIFKYGNMLLLPVLFAAAGAYYLWKRR